MSGAADLLAALLDATPGIVELGANKTVTSVGGAGIGVAAVSLFANGNWTGTVSPGGSGNFSSTWIQPTAYAGAMFEVKATLNSGTLSTGTTGSWLGLGTDRSWSCIGGNAANLTIEIRRAVGGLVVDSVTAALTGS